MSNKKNFTINNYYFSLHKRLFDVCMALIGIIAGLPIIILVAISVFFTSGRPVFFVQKRMGKNGKFFRIYKFRTMITFAEKEKLKLMTKNQAPYPMFKIFADPRFVGIGHFLSKTGLDEIPQLFNILKGEMSFVGPRPLPQDEAKKLLEVDPDFDFRNLVNPGIFSEWSLSDKRHKSLKEWKKLDQKTVGEGGVGYDLKIIFLTISSHLFKFFQK